MASRLLKQHPEQEATAISDCLDLVTRASQKVTDRLRTIHDQTVTHISSRTKEISSRTQDTQTAIHGLHTDVRHIQANQDAGRQSLRVLENAVENIGHATSRLQADMRLIMQPWLHDVFCRISHSTKAPREGESNHKVFRNNKV